MKFLLALILFILSQFVFAVDINTADAEELAQELSGVGKVKAQRIIEYREKIGGFISPEQLTEVYGIGPKTLERNKNKISIVPKTTLLKNKPDKNIDTALPQNTTHKTEISTTYSTSQPKTDIDLNLSPKDKKPPRPTHNLLWETSVLTPLFIICLFIFISAWLKRAIKNEPVSRKHLVNTTFVCSECGKMSRFQNIRYEGHFSHQYIDGDLPPGWACIPNGLGEPCDYCFECSQKVHEY
ncbi:helix-hairpin-helix domain-containing protein [Candidatus Parabeggiatoa sp. HSG14]|uniref:ComEA family DNA-binding protein n=1 Tax=Candidatus Parabeggiatoa sp. HSG14 TaxID=3055593 RepID=UPI0025A91B19|nr:helix-hairpin-helix domain-containing protein [Thiotrichales bacterium HSG14]